MRLTNLRHTDAVMQTTIKKRKIFKIKLTTKPSEQNNHVERNELDVRSRYSTN